MEPKILEALKQLVGEEQALALAGQVDSINQRVAQEHLIARDSSAQPEAAAKSEPVSASVPATLVSAPAPVVEPPEVLAVRELRAVQAELARTITDLQERLEALERNEHERREAWKSDLPVPRPRVLVRPRDVRPAETAEKPADERVRETLSQKGIVI